MRKILFVAGALAVVGFGGLVSQVLAADRPGYTDTPMLPSGKWHVHDPNRPEPVVVTPAPSFSLGAAAPSDATVLFNGADLSNWRDDKGGESKWVVKGDYMECVPKSGYIYTKEKFGDFQLHLEWAEPAKVHGNSQDRGNSGVFLQSQFEVQVLDNYNNPTYPDGQCGAIYGQTPPLVNACKKPDEWQSYDIFFTAARWDDNHQLTSPAYVTVIQNGILVQNHQPIIGPTGHRILANYKHQLPETGPLGLQDHGNPIRYRNIWIRNITQAEIP
jgi:hypothetical protein